MGDRGNICLRQRDGDVWFYSHWGGSEIQSVTQRALARGRDRWTDEAYLARIVFCELVKGNEIDLTGFGISTCLQDNEHDVVVVDVPKQRVFLIKEAELTKQGTIPPDYKPKTTKSFQDFIKQKLESEEV